MKDKSSVSSSDASEINQLCDRFESALRAGERPSVQDYVRQVSEPYRAALLVEFYLRECACFPDGVSALFDQYRAQFPQYAELLADAKASLPMAADSAAAHALSDTAVDEFVAPVLPRPALTGKASTLAQTWPISELPLEVIIAVAEQMGEETYAAGEILIRQGEQPERLLVLVDGDAEVHLQEGASDHTISRLAVPCLLGEMGILTAESCTATVIAKSPVRVLTLPAEKLFTLTRRYPALLPAISRLVAERLGKGEVDALAGKTLRNYHIEHGVGSGGMGTVYLATDTRSGRQVALKMMSHRFLYEPEALARFEREFEICRTLRHDNIARVYEHFTAFGTHFMAMEFCSGKTLQELIQRCAPFPEDAVRKIAGQLAQALVFAHRSGVCHRDIKPSNVMIREDGLLKLMDFGLAKSRYSTELTTHGQVFGTIRYMPLEQVEGEQVDYRADVFAFGCIVYEMLTGRYFLQGQGYVDVLREHFQMAIPPKAAVRDGLSDDLYRVLAESLPKAPCDRVLDLQSVGAWAGSVDVPALEALANEQRTLTGSIETIVKV